MAPQGTYKGLQMCVLVHTHRMYLGWSLRTLHLLTHQVKVTWCRWLGSLLFCSCDVLQVLFNSLVDSTFQVFMIQWDLWWKTTMMRDHNPFKAILFLNSFPFTASLELTESNFIDHSWIWGRSLLSVCHSIFIQILHLTKKEKCTKNPARSIHTCTTSSTWKRFWVYTSIQNCTHTTGNTNTCTHTHTHTHTHTI